MSDTIENGTTETTKAVKAPFVPVTQGQARMVIERLRKGISAAHKSIDDREAQIASLESLIPTLPEAAAATPAAARRPKIEPGTVVQFRYGRGESAKVRDGVVKARKDNADGNPELYRVESGEGFDAELLTVYPGQITVVVVDTQPGE